MRCKNKLRARPSAAGRRAFTLVEVMVASGLAGVMFLAFMGGMSMTFQGVQIDRENSRATQILLEKTEMLRLYNWSQITGGDTNTYVPGSFTAPFYPNANNGGFTYTGAVTIATAPVTENYSNDMRQITLTLNWTSGGVRRSRSMSTLVSRYGLQNYVY